MWSRTARRALSASAGAASAICSRSIKSTAPMPSTVTAPWNIGEGPQADAMATNVPGLALGILTADCAPVLFADAEADVIGAAHAGWKGAHRRRHRFGPSRRWSSWARSASASPPPSGPCISQTNYEVGAEFRAAFLRQPMPATARFFVPSDERRPLPLRSAGLCRGTACERRNRAGRTHLAPAPTRTKSDFFSFRRATHRGEKDYGRQLSAIVLTA